MFKVGIIGCGLIGSRRAKFLGNKSKLVACSDFIEEKASNLAKNYPGVKIYKTSKELLEDESIDIVIISTLHDSLASLTLEALKHNKHILVEKPAARSKEELIPILRKSLESNLIVHVDLITDTIEHFRKQRIYLILEQLVNLCLFVLGMAMEVD